MVPALILRLAGELLCWRAERDQAIKLDTAVVVVRLTAGLLCAAIMRLRENSDVGTRRPLWLRLAALLEMSLYAVSYLPHLLKTFLLNDQATLAAVLILCVDVSQGEGAQALLLPVVCVVDYVGVVAASGLLCWAALQRPRSGPLLLLLAANSAVGITVALRQAAMAVTVRSFLWGLVLYSLAQLAHSLWNLLLPLLADDASATTPQLIGPSRSSGGCSRAQALRARALGCVDPRPDALGFFRLDGRCLLELLSTAFNLGVVLYQLTKPLSATEARRTLLLQADIGKALCGPRLGCAL
ncbi:uncharacterized protein LOC144103785 [Amblyomma americanum]